jgi:hypothetical protein
MFKHHYLLCFLFVLMLMTTSKVHASNPIVLPDSLKEVKPKRVAVVAGTTTLALAGTYAYLQNVWWKDQQSSFKIDHDMDYRYAKNMDKAAHFIGGAMSADLFGVAFEWAGVKRKNALLFGGIAGTAIQAFIEVKDAYAPTYGFSFGDLGAGAAGSFLPLLQYHVPASRALQLKLSYYKHDNYYYQQFPYAQLIDDYMNQTYWLSASVNDWLPKGSRVEKLWPDFLSVCGGWGVANDLNLYYTGQNLEVNKGKGTFEYYVSVDVDWRKIIKQNTAAKRVITYTLNHIKLPLPTLQVGPQTRGYWAFW